MSKCSDDLQTMICRILMSLVPLYSINHPLIHGKLQGYQIIPRFHTTKFGNLAIYKILSHMSKDTGNQE